MLCKNVLPHARLLSRVGLFVTPWTVAHQASLSMEFSRQEYYSGLPFPSPGDLPDPGKEPEFLEPPALAGVFITTAPPGKPKLSWVTVKSHLLRTFLVLSDRSVYTLPAVPMVLDTWPLSCSLPCPSVSCTVNVLRTSVLCLPFIFAFLSCTAPHTPHLSW